MPKLRREDKKDEDEKHEQPSSLGNDEKCVRFNREETFIRIYTRSSSVGVFFLCPERSVFFPSSRPKKTKKTKKEQPLVSPQKVIKSARERHSRDKYSTTQKLFGTPLSVPKIRIHTNNAEYDIVFFFVFFFFCDDGDAKTKRRQRLDDAGKDD